MMYFPVEPTLDEQGNLVSIVSLYPNAKAQPVPLDAGQELFSTPGFETSILNYSTSASLKYSGFMTNSFDLDSKVFVVDVICYSENLTPGAADNIVIATRWGCGLRIFYSMTDIKGQFKLDIASIAAAAELGLACVSYKITGIGIGLKGFLTLLGKIDPFGVLTLDAAAKMASTILNKDTFSASVKALKEAASGGKPVLSSVPLEVLLRWGFDDAGKSIPQSVVFGLRCLRHGMELRQALAEGGDAGYDKRSIQKAYSLIYGSSDYDRMSAPTTQQSTLAQNWLDLNMV